MRLEELLELLDIEEPSEFEYFENLADLLECEEEIPYEVIYQLIRDVDNKILAELINNYFEDMLNAIPDAATDFYTQLQTIGMSLVGMADGMREEDEVVQFCEELDRFRRWYIDEGIVNVRPVGSRNEDFREVSPCEAIVMARTEKVMPDESYEYDFNSALDYELKDYVLSFKDALAAEDGDEAGGAVNEDGDLLDGYVYDDEFKDEY